MEGTSPVLTYSCRFALNLIRIHDSLTHEPVQRTWSLMEVRHSTRYTPKRISILRQLESWQVFLSQKNTI